MRRSLVKAAALVLSLGMMLIMLTACGSEKTGAPAVEETADAPLYAATEPVVIVLEADGQRFTFENAAGTEIQELLKQAGITLEEGDTLSFAPDQAFPGSITLHVLRQHTVTVWVVAESNFRHSAVLMEGTVADAIAAVGVELAENQTVNFALNTPLEDGMEIIVSGASLQQEPEPEPPTEPEVTEPEPEAPTVDHSGKTIVSIDVYEDCDGSGHGIKIITYSDGTQEEVLF